MEENFKAKILPCEPCKGCTANPPVAHLSVADLHTPDGILLDTSHSIGALLLCDTHGNGHHIETHLKQKKKSKHRLGLLS